MALLPTLSGKGSGSYQENTLFNKINNLGVGVFSGRPHGSAAGVSVPPGGDLGMLGDANDIEESSHQAVYLGELHKSFFRFTC